MIVVSVGETIQIKFMDYYREAFDQLKLLGGSFIHSTRTKIFARSAQTWKEVVKILQQYPVQFDKSAEKYHAEVVMKAQQIVEFKQHKDYADTGQCTVPASPEIKTPLFPHQVQGAYLGMTRGSLALLYDMGTGKSLLALMLIALFRMQGTVKRTLLVAPLTVIYGVWAGLPVKKRKGAADFEQKEAGQIQKHSTFTYAIVHGTKKKRLAALASKVDIYLINYEGLRTMEKELKVWMQQEPAIIIFDESVKVKNHTAKHTVVALALAEMSPHRFILTGLPTPHSYKDFFTQLRIIEPDIFSSSYVAFKNRYCVMAGDIRRQFIVAYRNLEELKQKVELVSYKKHRRECSVRPEKIRMKRIIEMPTGIKKFYNKIKNDEIADFNYQSITGRMIQLQRLTGGYDIFEERFIWHGKLEECKLILEQAGDQKVLIWVAFRKEVEYLTEKLEKYNPAHIWGGLKGDEIAEAVSSFQNDEKCRVFIGIPAACKYGLSLARGNIAVYYSNSFDYDGRAQSEDRVDRITGQERNIYIVDLIVRGTLDAYILRNLSGKRDRADRVYEWGKLNLKGAGNGAAGTAENASGQKN